jgi:SAM-dependent methyltransferase
VVRHPDLPPEIVVLPGTDVEAEWERFHLFEALHHSMVICNPMASQHLDEVIRLLAPRDGDGVLDIACGHGELLRRMAVAREIDGVGVDLSPWVLVRALQRARAEALRGKLTWWLGNGAHVPREERWDVATCLGAPWVFHGFAGTAQALAARLRPGGRMAIGDLRVRDDADPAAVAGLEGKPLDRPAQLTAFAAAQLEPVDEIVVPYPSIMDYQARVTAAAESYAAQHPGDPEMDFRQVAADGRADFERDAEVLTWSVWVAARE